MNQEQTNSERDIYLLAYSIIAAPAKLKLIESMLYLGLIDLLIEQTKASEDEIIERLQLHPARAKKWLTLLNEVKFVEYEPSKQYTLGAISKKLIGDNGKRWWVFKELIYGWRSVSQLNLAELLQGGETPDVNWPPKTEADVENLELWMRESSSPVIHILNKYFSFNKINKLLDVGGGDGSIACSLARTYPHLKISVYNLEHSCKLAKQNIETFKVSDQVDTIVGNFFEDTKLPGGYDAILLSRVLCDWPENTCERILSMAYKALAKNGQLIICESFRESNEDLALMWEFRYLFWDQFDTGVYKSAETYKKILQRIGFTPMSYSQPDNRSLYQVLVSKK